MPNQPQSPEKKDRPEVQPTVVPPVPGIPQPPEILHPEWPMPGPETAPQPKPPEH